MTALPPPEQNGETTLTVSIGALPFAHNSRKLVRVEDAVGRTVRDIIGPAPEAEHHVIVATIEGELIEDWDFVIQGTSSPLYLDVVPQSRNFLALTAVVAIAVFAPAAAGYITGATSGFAYSATLGVISAVGSIVVGKLIGPPPAPGVSGGSSAAAQRDPQRFGIRGTSNQSPAVRSPVLCVMGKHRVTPYLATQGYVYVIDDETMGYRGLYDFGYGPIEFEEGSHKFGDDPVMNFSNATIVEHEGVIGSASTLSQFNEVHDQSNVNAPLPQEEGWKEFTFEKGVAYVNIIVIFNSGLVQYDDQNKKKNRTVAFEAQVMQDGAQRAATSWSVRKSITSQVFSSATLGLGLIDKTKGGTMRVRRTTNDSTSTRVRDEANLAYVDFVTQESPVKATGRALVYINIRADRNLNNVVNTYNAVCTRKIPAWSSGSGWGVPLAGAQASSPAWLFADILRGPGIAVPVADAQVDAEMLAEFDAYCTSRGYRYDGVWQDSAGVWERLSSVCSAGRASPTLIDASKYSVIIDQKKDVPIDLITPKDAIRFRAVRQFDRSPHAFRAVYNNRDDAYRESEVIIYAPGRSARNSTDIRAVMLREVGITTAAEAHKYLRYLLAVKLLRPESFHVVMDIKNVRLQRGDYVDLQYDTILVGLGASRVERRKVVGGMLTEFSLQEFVELDEGEDHVARFQTLGGSSVRAGISQNAAMVVPETSASGSASATLVY